MLANLIFKLFFLSNLIALLNAAVIGIDFGSQYFKVSMIQPGKSFTIVENKLSKRKTPTAISFIKNERIYETEAESKKSKQPTNTFLFINKFLGALESDQQIFEVSKSYYEDFLFSFDPEHKTVMFNLVDFQYEEETLNDGEHQQDKLSLSVEQVTAQILRYAKKLSDAQSNQEVKECIITVPSHWNLRQRNALKQATSIAGLQLLGFVHENTAAAVQYGIDRIDENKTHTVLFYNLGADNLQTSIVQYQAFNFTKKKPVETITVVSDYAISGLGGRALDLTIANMIADSYDNQPKRKGKPSIKQSKKSMMKLLQQAQKVKEQLSASKEIPVFIENLIDGQDYKGAITRSKFEEKSAPIFTQLTKPIEQVLSQANITLSDIDAIELIGGGVRVPKIQEILKSYVGNKDIGAHLNGDEAMALGASFIAANCSPSFRVRDIRLNDGFNFEVELVIKNLDETIQPTDELYYYKNLTLFNFKKRFGSKKSIAFKHFPVNLQIELYLVKDNKSELFSVTKLDEIESIKNDSLFQKNETAKPKYHLEFSVNSVDVVTLDSAELEFNYTEIISQNKSIPKPDYENGKYKKMWEEFSKFMNDSEFNDTNFNQTGNFFNFNETDNSTDKQGDNETSYEEQQESTDQQQQQQQQQEEQSSEEGQSEYQQERDEANKTESSDQSTDNTTSQEQESSQESENGESSSSTTEDEETNNDQESQDGSGTTNTTLNETISEEGQNFTTTNKTTTKKQKKSKEQSIKKKLRQKYVKQEFTSTHFIFSELDETSFHKSTSLIRQLDNSERRMRNLAETKNQFETLLYEIKGYPEIEIFINATKETEREELYKMRDEAEQWFQSDEAYKATYSDYRKKINQFQNLMQPVQIRIEEYAARPKAYNKSIQVLSEYYEKFIRLNKSMPWLTDEQKNEFMFEFNQTYKWIYEQFVQQDQLPLYEDPIFRVDDIKPKLESLKKEFNQLKNIKKPKNFTNSENSTNTTEQNSQDVDGENQQESSSDSKQKQQQQKSDNEQQKSKSSSDQDNDKEKEKNKEKSKHNKKNSDSKKSKKDKKKKDKAKEQEYKEQENERTNEQEKEEDPLSDL